MSLYQLYLDTRDAWLSLLRRPLRSLLSSFGIGVGVAALVAMLSISEGAKQKALAKIVSLGTNTLRIENAVEHLRFKNESVLNLSQGITLEDARSLASWLATRGHLAAYVRKDNVQVTAGMQSTSATIIAVTETWFSAEKLILNRGRRLNRGDSEQAKRVCVVGIGLAQALQLHHFAPLRVDNLPLKVVGELRPKGHLLTEGTGLSSLDFDTSVIIPFSVSPFLQYGSGRILVDGMVVALKSSKESTVFKVAEQIEKRLLMRHKGIKDFRLVVPLSLMQEARESQQLFSFVMGSIAGLSLLVGGIGIMNVMLANISEQTREIGLRMAVGATRARIISLFLWNSVLLTIAGAVWGVAGGVALAILVQEYAGWQTVFSYSSLFIAPVSAIITGLLFGLHPAIRAASLDPAIALRDS